MNEPNFTAFRKMIETFKNISRIVSCKIICVTAHIDLKNNHLFEDNVQITFWMWRHHLNSFFLLASVKMISFPSITKSITEEVCLSKVPRTCLSFVHYKRTKIHSEPFKLQFQWMVFSFLFTISRFKNEGDFLLNILFLFWSVTTFSSSAHHEKKLLFFFIQRVEQQCICAESEIRK